jgi:hypothetical protein
VIDWKNLLTHHNTYHSTLYQSLLTSLLTSNPSPHHSVHFISQIKPIQKKDQTNIIPIKKEEKKGPFWKKIRE